MAVSTIPTIDLLPFLTGDSTRPSAIDKIARACTEYGFFMIENHGIPLDLIDRALLLSKKFFESHSDKMKLKLSPPPGAGVPAAGYGRQPEQSVEKSEYLMLVSPENRRNVYPDDPVELKEVLEELFSCLTKLGLLLESIISECFGLPPSFLRDYNRDRSCDFMTTKRYFPATETENIGISQHEDGNLITFVIQDDAGGLQVKQSGEWIDVTPSHGKLVVNIGDVIRVLSNDKMKSATHRVMRPEGRSCYSITFFYNLNGEKWVEPLPKFTKEIEEAPKYRGFLYKDYLQLRFKNKTHPPSSPQYEITLAHYAISK